MGCVCTQKEIYSKALTHVTMETESPKSAEWAHRLETREEKRLQFTSKGHLLLNSLLLEQVESSVPFRPSADWMRPTHNIKSYLLCSRFTGVNVNVTQKHCHRNIQKNV